MNIEQTIEILDRYMRFGPEMEAFVRGKVIQVKAPSGWISEFNPTWSFNCEYRVRPEPIECWVNVLNGDMCSTVHMTKEDATSILISGEHWTMRKFREVIE